MSNTLELPHEELMAEEAIRYVELPQEIKDDIQDFEELKSEYRENPSEIGRETLIKESIKIADTIQDWLEQDLPDSQDDDDDDEKPSHYQPNWKFW